MWKDTEQFNWWKKKGQEKAREDQIMKGKGRKKIEPYEKEWDISIIGKWKVNEEKRWETNKQR